MFFVTFLSGFSNTIALMSCFSWKSRSKSSSCRIPLLCIQHLFFPCQFSISTDKVMFFKIGLSLQHLCPWCVACEKMVFYYQNCSDLLWDKIVLVIEKNFWNSRLKAENFQKFWDHWNNLFKQWKVRTIFGNRILF